MQNLHLATHKLMELLKIVCPATKFEFFMPIYVNYEKLIWIFNVFLKIAKYFV